MGHNIEASELVEILLQSLTNPYNQLVINLTNNTESLVFDYVVAVIHEE